MTIHRDTLRNMEFSDVAIPFERLDPVTPGSVLLEEFMKPLGLSARALAREIDVPPNRITEIVSGERAVSAKTAILFSERFGTSPEFWMNLQTAHELEVARDQMPEGWLDEADHTENCG